ATARLTNIAVNMDVDIGQRIEKKIKVKVSSDPPLSQEDIASVLTFGSLPTGATTMDSTLQGVYEGDDMSRAFVTAGVQASVLSYFNNSVKRMFNLDEFVVVDNNPTLPYINNSNNSAYDSNNYYFLQVGKALTDNLFLRSYIGIGQTNYTISLSYTTPAQFSFIVNYNNYNSYNSTTSNQTVSQGFSYLIEKRWSF
ncbi:MAG: translocation/assembly module TamB, partial [Negativicutes bacterium]|nr:translocation/assembly module TamB [Negativicutes bacterium]